ncbi:zinc-binding dehydrogenase [Amycolatopsis acidicola]|uniref:Zinc-binding dehydrogenase n=1 Tax=Amycolatopsis acidicola TaxID=2596893 RepID=A0A5N0VI47_9PSEU|nr:zinc-binding dehydrogenase [Amycolatopsis acidicola]KAA9166029.1 zinc-binding dehydrogenase [Amycolatopsis acidicola]
MGGKMRAAVPIDGEIELAEVPVPEPGPREVLVAVHAAGMNRADLLHRRGRYRQQAFRRPGSPDIAGLEFAGEIAAVGADVREATVGRRVMAMCGGAYAEYVAVDERLLLPSPDGLQSADCAALPMALLTEFEALVRLAGFHSGDRVLVTGATSSAGLAGVQLAHCLGAEVVATTRSLHADSLLRDVGADLVVHNESELAEQTGSTGVDIVIDHVGGAMFEASVTVARTRARLVSVGRLGGRSASLDLADLAARRARVTGTTWKNQTLDEIAACVDEFRRVAQPLVDAGRIKPVTGRRIQFADIRSGYEHLTAPREPGKPVVIF